MTAATRAASISAVAALMLAAVWFLWPSGLGGGTTYVSTHGISMEPRFHTGDLAVLRAADSLLRRRRGRVPERDAQHDRHAPDRLRRRARVRDPGRQQRLAGPGPADRGPGPGPALPRVPHARQGAHGARALPASCRSVGPASSRSLRFVRPPRQRRGATAGATAAAPRPSHARSGRGPGGGAGLGCGRAARRGRRRRPAGHAGHQTDTRTLQVTQQGEFSYTGTAERGATYPTGVIATGDTVWTRLSRGLTVSFADTVSGPGLAGLRGAVRLDVGVAAADGWSAVVTRGPSAPLRNGTATASVPWTSPRRGCCSTGTSPRSARPTAPRS